MILYVGTLNARRLVRGKIASGVAVRDDGGVAGEGRAAGVPKFHSWDKCTMPLTNINSDWMSNASYCLCILDYIKQLLHAIVLDIKVYYYLRNAMFYEAAGRVEYCHSESSNKPDIQHSKSAICVLLYSLHLNTKPSQSFEDRNDTLF